MDEVVRAVLATHGKLTVPASGVGYRDDLYALGLTSHASVNVMLALEEHYDLEFPDHLLRKSTFGSIASLCEALETLKAA